MFPRKLAIKKKKNDSETETYTIFFLGNKILFLKPKIQKMKRSRWPNITQITIFITFLIKIITAIKPEVGKKKQAAIKR